MLMRTSIQAMRLLRGLGRHLFALFVGLLFFAIALLVTSPWVLEWAGAGGLSPDASRSLYQWLERINAIVVRVLIGGWVFALGSCIASFLNVVAYRLPRGRGILGRSSCPRCRHHLTFWENMPVFGWLRCGGRCQVCQVRMSSRYLWVELVLGAIYFGLFIADVGIGPMINALQNSDAAGYTAVAYRFGILLIHLIAASALFLGFLILLEVRSRPTDGPAGAGPSGKWSGNG
jgi:hypothetical protein